MYSLEEFKKLNSQKKEKTYGPSGDDVLYQKYLESKPQKTWRDEAIERLTPKALTPPQESGPTYLEKLAENRANAQKLSARVPATASVPDNIRELIFGKPIEAGTVNPRISAADFSTRYDSMTDREKAVYSHLKNTNAKDADEYLKAIDMDINQRNAEKRVADARKIAEESAAAGLYARFMGNNVVSNGAASAYELWRGLRNQPVDPNHPLLAGQDIVKGQNEAFVGDSTGIERYLREGAMGAFDFGTNLMTAGAAGLRGQALQNMVKGSFAAQAFAGSARDAAEREGTGMQSVLTGTASAVLATVIEGIGLDRLAEIGKLANARGVLKSMAKSILPEAAEEAAEEAGNILADAVIMGDKNEIVNLYNTAKANGATQNDAMMGALGTAGKRIGESAIIGGISGGMIGGGVAMTNRALGGNALQDETEQLNRTTEQANRTTVQNPVTSHETAISDELTNSSPATKTQPTEAQTKQERDRDGYLDKYYHENGANILRAEAENRGSLQEAEDIYRPYYTAGLTGQAFDSVKGAMAVNADRSVAMEMYQAGVNDKAADMEARIKGQDKLRRSNTGVNLMTEAITDQQKALANLVAKVGRMNVTIVDTLGKDGKVGNNGEYTRGTNEVVIAMDAESFSGTLFHETVHYIKQANAKGYERMAEAVFRMAAEMDGVSVSDYLRRYESMEAYGPAIEAGAYNFADVTEELVADAFQMLAADEARCRSLIAELQQTEPTVLEQIKEFLQKMLETLEGLVKDGRFHAFAEDINKDIENTKKLQKIFAEELREAGKTAETKKQTAEQGALEKVGVQIDTATQSAASMKHSLKTWESSDYVKDINKAAEEMAKALDISVKKARKYIRDVNGIAAMIADDKVRLDYDGYADSAFVSNSEYGGSIDMSTICKKRRWLTGTLSAIQRALPNTALTEDEILDIRSRMKERNYEVSCGLCYVEGSRTKMGMYTQKFIEMYARTNPPYVPNMAEMNTPEGLMEIKATHPEVYKWYEYFYNHGGRLKDSDPYLFASQQKPKLYQMATAYDGEILKKFGFVPSQKKKKTEKDLEADEKRRKKKEVAVRKKNLFGGLRIQSFSDFEIIHLIDMMQVIMDMARVGLAGQAYTKVPDFAWALGDTGLKINLSLIAKGVDENGRLILDDVEGMPQKDAKALRDRYSDNVGTIIVVFNDEQLKAAMADDFIDFIIPFHRSQWAAAKYVKMGLPGDTRDYTNYQSEKFIEEVTKTTKTGKVVKVKAKNLMPNDYWDFSRDGKWNAENYLRICAEQNRRPKFSHLLVDNGDGSYGLQDDGSTDGYWKLLIDFKMYNNDGKGVPQKPVKPDFNLEQAERMLREYEGGHETFPVAQDVVDEFVTEKQGFYGDQKKYSMRVTDKKTLDFLNNQKTIRTYRAMQLIDGKLYPPMAAAIDGELEDYSILGEWEQAVEHPELATEDGYFKLNKGSKQSGVKLKTKELKARYNPYMHSSNVVLNDQFDGAYERYNLVTVECEVPVSEKTSGYKAEKAKDAVGWSEWKSGVVAGDLRRAKENTDEPFERMVFLSRWLKPVRIMDDSEVAKLYKGYLEGTDIAVPDSRVSPGLLKELKKIGVPIKETGKVKYSVRERDAEYMAAVEFGDTPMVEALIRQAANENGYTSPKLYHGTPEFGFTEIDFKKSDDRISFFMTDAVGTAMSYAGTDKVREISGEFLSDEDLQDAVDDEYDNMHEAVDDIVYALRKLGNEWAVAHEYVSDGVEKIADRLVDGEIDFDEADNEMYEFCTDVLYDLYDGSKDYDAGIAEMEFWEFEEYAAEKGYYDVVTKATRSVFKYADAYKDLYFGSDRGIYGLYANTSGYLEVDAEGKRWDAIGYIEGGRTYNTTRQIADYAKWNGYNGVIFRNLKDFGNYGGDGNPATVYIAFDGTQVKSADAVVYDESGAIIPLSERFDPNKKDIRWSVRESGEAELRRENASLMSENKHLQKMVENLKHQFELTDGTTPDQKSVRRVAKAWLKQIESKADLDDFSMKLGKITEYFAKAESKNDREHAMAALRVLVRDAMEQAETLNTETRDEYSGLIKQIKNASLKVTDELRSELENYGGYNTIRRANFGRMNLSANGKTSIDEFYYELCQEYHEFFREEDAVDEAEQLMNIIAVLDTLKPVAENPYGYDIEEYVYDETMGLLDKMVGIQMEQTFADKKKADKTAALQKLREEFKGEKQKMRDNAKLAKEKYEKELDGKWLAERMYSGRKQLEAAAKYQRLKDRNKANADKRKRSAYRKSAEKALRELLNWMRKPNEKGHVQEAYLPLIEVLTKIDTGRKDIEIKQADVVSIVSKLDKLENEGYASDLTDAVRNIANNFEDYFDDGMHLEDMTTEQMKILRDFIKGIKRIIVDNNKAKAMEQIERISDLGDDVIDKADKSKNVKATGRVRALVDFFGMELLTPNVFFKGIADSVHENLYKGLRKAHEQKAAMVNEAMTFINEESRLKDRAKWERDKVREFTVSGGQKAYLTIPQIMSLYCHMKREQSKVHIVGGEIKQINGKTRAVQAGGIQIEPYDGRWTGLKNRKAAEAAMKQTERIMVTEEDVKTITDTLTDQQKNLADAVQKFFSTTASGWGNKTSMLMWGYRNFLEPNYFPIESSEDYMVREYGVDADGRPVKQLKNLGFTHNTVTGANNPIIIRDIFSVFATHIDQMASYAAFVPILSDMQKFMNYKQYEQVGVTEKNKPIWKLKTSTKEALKVFMGLKAEGYINDLMRQINMAAGRDDTSSFPVQMTRRMKIAAVGANLRVMAQQPTSIVRAASVMNPLYLLNPANTALPADYRMMYKYAPISLWKKWGGADMDTGRTMKQMLTGGNWYDKTVDISMWGAGALDARTWGRIWKACVQETKANNPKLEGEELYLKAGQRFADVIDETQVVDTPLHRTAIMRKDSALMKMATSFMSEPLKTYNMFFDSARNLYQNPKDAKAYGKFVTTSFVLFLNAVAVSAAAGLVDAMRDDDEDDEFWDKWMKAFKGDYSEVATKKDFAMAALTSNLGDNMNPVAMIPFVKDVWSIIQGYDVERADVTWMADMVNWAKNMMKFMEGDSKFTMQGMMKNTAENFSKMLGVPAKSLIRELESIENTYVNHIIKVDDADRIEEQISKKARTHRMGSEENLNYYIEKIVKLHFVGNDDLGASYANKLVESGIDSDKVKDRIDSALKDRCKAEPAAMEAAEAWLAKDYTAMESKLDELQDMGYSGEVAQSAMTSLYNKMVGEDDEPSAEEIKDPFDGDGVDYKKIYRADLKDAYESGGNTERVENQLRSLGLEDKDINGIYRDRISDMFDKANSNGNTTEMERLIDEYVKYNGKESTLRNRIK